MESLAIVSTAASTIVCSTARLARSLRLAHGRARQAAGDSQWQPLPALTLQQWLAATLEQAMLQSEIALQEAPRLVLNKGQEQALWERVIERTLTGDAAALFDRAGLAKAAMEANQLMQEWNIAVPQTSGPYGHAEEVSQFLQWRVEFRRLCQASNWMEGARYVDWQTAQLTKGAGKLPAHLIYAGFDRISPQEQRLLDALTARGVQVSKWDGMEHAHAQLNVQTQASQIGLSDCEAECRAAVAWLAARLQARPDARLGLVVPELANLRQRITALLDDVLHPATASPAHAEATRSYDLSLGEALSRHPLVAIALELLRLTANRHAVSQQDFARVLFSPYWSASQSEADARAQLDARLRSQLPATSSLPQIARFTARQHARGLALAALSTALQPLLDAPTQASQRRLPSLWVSVFDQLLQAAQWPGERSLSSHEYQARLAFTKALTALADFDALSGPLSFAQAVQRLSQICSEQIFQPESQDNPQILVMGLLETVAEPLDGLWVMGMNDHLWPPPARPNPLIPASLQRAAQAPNADGPVQAAFAAAIHNRLLHSASEIMFSWAHKSGESELRVSPLLQGIAPYAHDLPLAQTLAETLTVQRTPSALQPDARQWLHDHIAPPVQAGEKISGGAGLIKAQAICPAWAYYRYRLGARPLDEAVEGLDSMDRGTLVHAVLQSFWQGRDSDWLHGLDAGALRAAIITAVEQGVTAFAVKREEALPANFLALEKQRLQDLLVVWLAYEKERPPFSVEQCEERVAVDIAGLRINLTLDRVDRLADGRLVVIDYKTGSAVSQHSWAEQRITEPQLPIYAALALADAEIAAVCFAQVRADEQRFVGIAADADMLPGINALQEASRLFPPDSFPDWIALLVHWKSSIEALAGELLNGEAAVVFRDESELAYCEVLPLLRLPERYLQLEAATRQAVQP